MSLSEGCISHSRSQMPPLAKKPQDPDKIFQKLGNDDDYKERIGKGAFGEVFRAIKLDTNQVVALKIIDLDGTHVLFRGAR